MRCEQVSEMLSAYFDDELEMHSVSGKAQVTGSDVVDGIDGEPADRAFPLAERIRDHLSGCEACASRLRSFEQLRYLALSQSASQLCPPSWQSMSTRLDKLCEPAPGAGSEVVTRFQETAESDMPHGWRRIAMGVLLALAASFLLFLGLRTPQRQNDPSLADVSVATLNLQPIIELFESDAEKAIKMLVSQHRSVEVSPTHAANEMGGTMMVQEVIDKGPLPGDAQLVSTKLMQFPYCKCPEGACTCGPGGCQCLACICQRPDGSTYLVLEHCKSQSVTFGDLPVQNVKRGDRHLQQVEVQGTMAISWERMSGRVTAIGLRNDDEVKAMLAMN